MQTYWTKEHIACPLCASDECIKLGIRGNREYFGADFHAEPHIVTDVVRCKVCDFIYTNPMIRGMEHLEKDYYDDPEKYSPIGESGSRAMFQKRLELVSAFKKPGLLLDIGAGKGEFLSEALKKGWKVQGVEPSANSCKFARERFRIELHSGRLGEIPEIPESCFDVVTLNHVLEHVDPPQALLQLIRRYLKRDGLLFIEVPNCDSYFLRIIDMYFRLKGLDWSSRLSPLHPPHHSFGFTFRSLEYLLRKCDYKPLKMRTFSGKERGYLPKKSKFHPEVLLRNIVSSSVNALGNRELLAVIAQPIE